MRLLFIFVLLSGQTFGYETVKNINGVKISGSILAQYDKFEGLYIIEPKNIDKTSSNLILSYVIFPQSIETYIELGFDTIDSFLDADQIEIFIENSESDFKKYTLSWSQKTVNENTITEDTSRTKLLKIFDLAEFGTGERKSSTLIREFSKINDPDLFKFFLENLSSGSLITIRFKNTAKGALVNIEVQRQETANFWNMIQLYKSLTENPQWQRPLAVGKNY